MPAEPFSWNAVVTGAWNVAILSPDGVRRRLFQLPDGTPIELQIAVDRPGLFRVGHDGLVVIPSSGKLEISTNEATPDSLARACELARRALGGLPETPVSAAGINVRYRFAELPDAMLDLVRAPLDAALADAEFTVARSATSRSLSVAPGVVNVTVKQTDGGGTIEFNFHRESTSTQELSDWLARHGEFLALSDRIAGVAGAQDVRREIHA